jgi:hypothetical protein
MPEWQPRRKTMSKISKLILQAGLVTLALGIASSANAAVRYTFDSLGVARDGIAGRFSFVIPDFIPFNSGFFAPQPGQVESCSIQIPVGAECGLPNLHSVDVTLAGEAYDTVRIFGFLASETYLAEYRFDLGSLSSSGDYFEEEGFGHLTVDFADIPIPSAMPDPANWMLMIAGFGLVGAATRRRRTTVRVTYA